MNSTNPQFQQLQDMMALMDKDEAFLPELEPYLQRLPNGVLMLNSPLVQELCVQVGKGAYCNKRYQLKKDAVERALREENWHTYIFMHERPYRFEAFRTIARHISPREYWKVVRNVWDDSENIWQHRITWANLFSKEDPLRPLLMSRRERKFLSGLPQKFVVYRGQVKKSHSGMSWTLDRDKAEWFASRYQRSNPSLLVKGIADKQFVIAYMEDRNESEIVIPHGRVADQHTYRVKPKVETQG